MQKFCPVVTHGLAIKKFPKACPLRTWLAFPTPYFFHLLFFSEFSFQTDRLNHYCHKVELAS